MVGWSSFSLRATACNASLVSIRFPTLLCVLIRWDEKAGLHGMRYAPNDRRARGTMKRRPAMKKISTVRVNGNMIFKGHKLTIGVDLGDRWSCYCVLDEAGEILLEQKVATTPEAMKQIFEKIPSGLIAMETGTHS